MSQLSIQSLQQLPGSEGLALTLAINQGIAGADGPNAVTSATTSDGTANLSVATISSQGAVLINPEFDNGIIAEESGGRSVFRVGGVIISAAEGSVDCGQVDTLTVNTTTLRASSTEYGNNATFTYGNSTAVANHRDAMGLGTGNNVTHATLITTENGTVSDPSVKIASHGFYQTGGNSLGLAIAGVQRYLFGNTSGSAGFRIISNTGIRVGDTADTSLSRISAGLWGVGSGALNSTDGDMQLRNLTASGTITLPENATFTYGTGAADAHLTALGAGATGVDVFQAATQGDARDAMGLGTGDSVQFQGVFIGGSGRRIIAASNGMIGFGSSATPTSDAIQLGFARLDAATMELRTQTGSDYRDLILRKITASGDIEANDATKGVILKSPNGTRYRVTVENDGTLTTTAL